MNSTSTKELIQKSKKALNRHTDPNGRLHSDVAAAVLGKNGKIYLGVCVDTPSWGLCAERSALAAMITDGEYRFEKIVAVWQDDKNGKLAILPPCGHCRQFMRDIDENNLESQIVLEEDKCESLKDLIPYHEWPRYMD